MKDITKERTQELKKIQKRLKIKFKNLKLLDLALTHRSFSKENNLPDSHSSERLEFLGDAVINLAISEYLHLKYPHLQEGDLTKIKSVVVSKDILPQVAIKLKLGNFILFGKSEKEEGKHKLSILENTFEALIGAIFLDKNYKIARDWLVNILKRDIHSIACGKIKTDYKSELQCISQKNFKCLPQYKVIKEEGPEHHKRFIISVALKNKKLGEGGGKTKKEAEQIAAREALEKLTVQKKGGANAIF